MPNSSTSGLSCPLPILKTKKALAGLRAVSAAVIASRPGIDSGFPETFNQQMGHVLLKRGKSLDNSTFYCARIDPVGWSRSPVFIHPRPLSSAPGSELQRIPPRISTSHHRPPPHLGTDRSDCRRW